MMTVLLRTTTILSALAIWNGGGVSAEDKQRPMRTFMTVEYDYRLEVNRTQSAGNNSTEDLDNIFNPTSSDKGRNAAAPLENALLNMETEITSYLQERIPGGDIPADGTLPDVEYTTINSRFINMCFTESDACKFVKSRIQLSYVENLPKASMERATLDLVRDYLNGVNAKNPSVHTMFVYPMIHSSTVQLDLSPVAGSMNDGDIDHLVTTFQKVFHAIVSSMDGDTDISEVFFVYQDVTDLEGSSKNEGDDKKNLSVNLKYFGKCRYCTEDDLASSVHQTFEPNQQALLANLKKYGKDTEGTYFKSVEEISFSRYTPPSGLAPGTNASIGDVAVAEKKIPWLLYIGVAAAIVVLGTGFYVIAKDQKELRKEDPDTGAESNSDDSAKAEDGNAGVKETKSNDSSTSSLNTNTLNKTGMHSDYEVYVY